MAMLNRFLQMLSERVRAAFDEHLQSVQLQRSGGAWRRDQERIFPHSGIVSLMVAIDDGAVMQTFIVGRARVVGAAQALDTKSVRQQDPYSSFGIASPRNTLALDK